MTEANELNLSFEVKIFRPPPTPHPSPSVPGRHLQHPDVASVNLRPGGLEHARPLSKLHAGDKSPEHTETLRGRKPDTEQEVQEQ